MVTNVDSIILDRYRFMYTMSVKNRLQVLIVLGILVNENEIDTIWSTYHIKGIYSDILLTDFTVWTILIIESVRTRTDKN